MPTSRSGNNPVLVRRAYLTSQNYRDAMFNREIHQRKIAKAKSTLNTWNDSHLRFGLMERNNRRVNRVKEARELEIKRLNEILVDRITHTVMQPSAVYGKNSSGRATTRTTGRKGKKLRGRADRPYTHRTLNYHTRRKAQEKIAEENLQIAKRILSKKPHMDRSEFVEHSRKHAKHRDTLSQFVRIPREQYDAMQAKMHHPLYGNNQNNSSSNGSMSARNGATGSIPMRRSQARKYKKMLELTPKDRNLKNSNSNLLVPVRQAEEERKRKQAEYHAAKLAEIDIGRPDTADGEAGGDGGRNNRRNIAEMKAIVDADESRPGTAEQGQPPAAAQEDEEQRVDNNEVSAVY